MQRSTDDYDAFIASLPPAKREAFLAAAFKRAKQDSQKAAQPAIGDFSAFKVRFWKGYTPVAHQRAIDDVLEQVARYILTGGKEGIGRLMIFMPPRHGKTESVSRMFPAYMLARLPSLKIILTSYGATLAEKNSHKVRRLITSSDYRSAYPETVYEGGTRKNWLTTAEGGIVAAGVGGSITGEGGYLIIGDDLTKGRAEAESAIKRATLKEWYQADLMSRLEEPGGAIIIMQTRYHTDDLPGYLLSSDSDDTDLETADQWHVLNLPALAGDNDPLGRDTGAALWPEKYPVSILNKRRAKMGEYDFQALYQQRPTAKDAGLFDTGLIQIVDSAPECADVVRFWDLAVSASTKADYSVGLKLGRSKDGNLYVLDVYRKQAAPTETSAAIVIHALSDGTTVKTRLEAENSARVQLDFLLRDPRLARYTIDAKSPQGDKYTRASPVAARVNNRQVFIVRGHWNRAFLDELALFPSVKNDDQVDAFSGAYDMISNTAMSFFLFSPDEWED